MQRTRILHSMLLNYLLTCLLNDRRKNKRYFESTTQKLTLIKFSHNFLIMFAVIDTSFITLVSNYLKE